MNLRTLNTELTENGGFSYSLTFGNMASTQNYSVAYAKETEKVFDHLPTEDEYNEYINRHITLLAREDFVLGGWEYEGQYYIDVAQLLDKRSHSKNMAVQIGNDRQQEAIYDLEYSETIKCK